MSVLQQIIRLKSLLKSYITETKEGNIHFGNFPHVGHIDNKLSMMPYQESMRNWFLPMGIPFTKQTEDRHSLSKKYIAYGIGDELFIHKDLYSRFLGGRGSGMGERTLEVPLTESSTTLERKGWLLPEKELYENLLWRLAIRTSGQDFQKMARVDFDTKLSLDKAFLLKDGWTVNRVIGSNAYYGMIRAKAKADGRRGIMWYNKYLVLADLTGGSGINIDGMMKFDRMPHPHTYSGLNLCIGGYGEPMNRHLNKGEITEFFIVMKRFLTHYNNDSPTFRCPIGRGSTSHLSGKGIKFFTSAMTFS